MKKIYISQSEYVLYDEPLIIYGYGRQGKLLYRYLHRMKKKYYVLLILIKKDMHFVVLKNLFSCIQRQHL